MYSATLQRLLVWCNAARCFAEIYGWFPTPCYGWPFLSNAPAPKGGASSKMSRFFLCRSHSGRVTRLQYGTGWGRKAKKPMDALTADRIQFAFTLVFHYLFPQLTMGLALLILILKTIGLRTANEAYHQAAHFWARVCEA